jgi:hypothetical protein
MTVEYADADRRSSLFTGELFPAEWGPAPMEKRARYAWIYEHCANPAAMTGKLRQLEIQRKRWGA